MKQRNKICVPDGIRTHDFQTTVRRSIAIVFVPLLTIGRIESGLGPSIFRGKSVSHVPFFLFSQVSAATPREEVVEAIRLKLMAVTEFSS